MYKSAKCSIQELRQVRGARTGGSTTFKCNERPYPPPPQKNTTNNYKNNITQKTISTKSKYKITIIARRQHSPLHRWPSNWIYWTFCTLLFFFFFLIYREHFLLYIRYSHIELLFCFWKTVFSRYIKV